MLIKDRRLGTPDWSDRNRHRAHVDFVPLEFVRAWIAAIVSAIVLLLVLQYRFLPDVLLQPERRGMPDFP